jgi:hypothetical protein
MDYKVKQNSYQDLFFKIVGFPEKLVAMLRGKHMLIADLT